MGKQGRHRGGLWALIGFSLLLVAAVAVAGAMVKVAVSPTRLGNPPPIVLEVQGRRAAASPDTFCTQYAGGANGCADGRMAGPHLRLRSGPATLRFTWPWSEGGNDFQATICPAERYPAACPDRRETTLTLNGEWRVPLAPGELLLTGVIRWSGGDGIYYWFITAT